jgi:putative toxin-antitoxin system antitoxin component (TIGR02293 family)
MATNLNNIGEYIGIVPKSGFDLVEIVEKGLPAESVGLLRDKGLTFTEVSEVIIPPRTLKRRIARGENLSHEETDRLLRVARIIGFAEHVFGNRVKALLWLRDPDDRLGDRTALSILATEAGGRVVEGMLWQIAEGMYT